MHNVSSFKFHSLVVKQKTKIGMVSLVLNQLMPSITIVFFFKKKLKPITNFDFPI